MPNSANSKTCPFGEPLVYEVTSSNIALFERPSCLRLKQLRYNRTSVTCLLHGFGVGAVDFQVCYLSFMCFQLVEHDLQVTNLHARSRGLCLGLQIYCVFMWFGLCMLSLKEDLHIGNWRSRFRGYSLRADLLHF